jgi:hypothetical protein
MQGPQQSQSLLLVMWSCAACRLLGWQLLAASLLSTAIVSDTDHSLATVVWVSLDVHTGGDACTPRTFLKQMARQGGSLSGIHGTCTEEGESHVSRMSRVLMKYGPGGKVEGSSDLRPRCRSTMRDQAPQGLPQAFILLFSCTRHASELIASDLGVP